MGDLTLSVGGITRLARSIKQALPAPVRRHARRARRIASYVPRQILGTITHVITDEPVVALTFDDGPDPSSTPRMLQALEAHGARGTFFLVGRAAERHAALVRRMAAGGHAIGNHSMDHRSLPQLSGPERRAEIRGWERVCALTGPRLFRPPYGDQTLCTRLDPLRLGWEVVAWSICANDWRGEDAGTIAARVLERLQPGSIVLLHDSLFHCEDQRFVERDATVRAVEMILEAAAQYRFVTVPQLLRAGRVNREIWIQPGQPGYLATLKRAEVWQGARDATLAQEARAPLTQELPGETPYAGRGH